MARRYKGDIKVNINEPAFPLAEARARAEHIAESLAPYCERIEIAGSIRRGRPSVRDIELVALPHRRRNLLGDVVPGRMDLEQFLLDTGTTIVTGGFRPSKQSPQRYIKFLYGPYKVDLFLPETADHWGSVLFIRTGSADFSHWAVSTRAREIGIRFKEARVFTYQFAPISTPEEEDVFAALRMPVVPPEARDNGRWLEYLKE